jgi:hypothetical protein
MLRSQDCARLEDATLRVDEWESFATEFKPAREVSLVEDAASERGEAGHMVECGLP